MKVSDKLGELYDGYYGKAEDLARKRAIAARQTVDHINALLPDKPYESLIDIGAGDGAVLAELDRTGFAENLHAVEISSSGVERIRSRGLSRLRTVGQFDGYRIEAPDHCYSVGTVVHVLEHVEHERAFLEEVTRVCDLAYIEVPLELTMRVERAIQLSGPYGHINFYTPSTFRNLLSTCGLEVLKFQVFSNSREYETHVSGSAMGALKHTVRSTLLKAFPQAATLAMAYLAGAVCRRSRP